MKNLLVVLESSVRKRAVWICFGGKIKLLKTVETFLHIY